MPTPARRSASGAPPKSRSTAPLREGPSPSPPTSSTPLRASKRPPAAASKRSPAETPAITPAAASKRPPVDTLGDQVVRSGRALSESARARTAERARSLEVLHEEIVACGACPRLVEWRERVAREKRRAYRDETYWGKPVPGFGDPSAPLVIVGLAPGAHGANRTGRAFTGDRSGDFLYAALHRAGLASQPASERRGDRLALTGAFITLAGRCAPPDNHPSRDELASCAPFLSREIRLLPNARSFLALGKIAYDAIVGLAEKDASIPPFSHGAKAQITLFGSGFALVASYHVSQQNTQTGRLTPAMFDAVVARALRLAT